LAHPALDDTRTAVGASGGFERPTDLYRGWSRGPPLTCELHHAATQHPEQRRGDADEPEPEGQLQQEGTPRLPRSELEGAEKNLNWDRDGERGQGDEPGQRTVAERVPRADDGAGHACQKGDDGHPDHPAVVVAGDDQHEQARDCERPEREQLAPDAGTEVLHTPTSASNRAPIRRRKEVPKRRNLSR